MKKTLLGLLAAAGLMTAPFASATVLTFDDLPNYCCGPVPNGYAGFNWNAGTTIGSLNGNNGYNGTGYQNGTISGNVAFNWYGTSNSVINTADNSLFTFDGAYFASAWSDQQISFLGYNGGNLVYSSGSYNVTTQGPTWIGLNWSGIDKLVINNNGSQWVMDNFTFNGQSVPEPGSLALLGLGLVGLGFARRKAAK